QRERPGDRPLHLSDAGQVTFAPALSRRRERGAHNPSPACGRRWRAAPDEGRCEAPGEGDRGAGLQYRNRKSSNRKKSRNQPVNERASRISLPRASATPSGARTPAQRAILFVSRVWAWLFLGLLILFFVVAVPLSTGGSVNFFTVRNSQNILVAIIPVLLLGLGQTFVIIAAGIDLSVGWVMSLASVLSALALRSAFNGGVPLFPAVLVGLLAAVGGAAAVGLVNG